MNRLWTYRRWRASRERNAEWVDRVNRALPPYRRERARDPDEAELLLERDTPSRLVGPSPGVRSRRRR